MKAIVYEEYGGPEVLQLRDIEKPAVGDDDVLVRIRASSANPLDWHFMRGAPYVMRLFSGLFGPKSHRLGVDLAGEVEAVGKNITMFRPGDEVYGAAKGAYAEHVCASADVLAPKPTNLSFEQAAFMFKTPPAPLESLVRRRGRDLRAPLRFRHLRMQMAEAHGNRTHPPRGNPRGTTVLKTAGGTSPRALPLGIVAGFRAKRGPYAPLSSLMRSFSARPEPPSE